MENILHNELVVRGFAVDVGSVRFTKTVDGRLLPERWYEIDFVVNRGSQEDDKTDTIRPLSFLRPEAS
ncbi:MAG: hypothetical protein ACOYEL_07805 [Saccharofermentanales bacterium]|jgi:hypothetical protein